MSSSVMSSNFNLTSTSSTDWFSQFKILIKRGLLYNLRNKRSSLGLYFVALCNGLLYGAVFHALGDERLKFDPFHPMANAAHNQQVQQNYVGMVFFASMDSFLSPALSQIIQLPLLRPVFVREMSSKMYSSHVYFLANWFTSTLNLMMYPLITSAVSFWFLKMNESGFENYMRWLLTLSLSTLQGSTFGFMFGIIYNDIESAANVMSTIACCLTYTCGVYVNLKTGPWYIRFMGYISPFRYTCEKLMRILLRGLPYVD